MVAQDIVSYYKDNWDNINTSGVTPTIGYDTQHDETESGDGYVIGHYNRGVFFKNVTYEADEIGLNRSHHDEGSEDVYEVTCVDFSKAKCRELIVEVMRVARLVLEDDKHSWVDWSLTGNWDQNSPKQRKVFIFNILYSRSGIPF